MKGWDQNGFVGQIQLAKEGAVTGYCKCDGKPSGSGAME
jgi:hypothetical protein